jgi:hypothetical protein
VAERDEQLKDENNDIHPYLALYELRRYMLFGVINKNMKQSQTDKF